MVTGPQAVCLVSFLLKQLMWQQHAVCVQFIFVVIVVLLQVSLPILYLYTFNVFSYFFRSNSLCSCTTLSGALLLFMWPTACYTSRRGVNQVSCLRNRGGVNMRGYELVSAGGSLAQVHSFLLSIRFHSMASQSA